VGVDLSDNDVRVSVCLSVVSAETMHAWTSIATVCVALRSSVYQQMVDDRRAWTADCLFVNDDPLTLF